MFCYVLKCPEPVMKYFISKAELQVRLQYATMFFRLVPLRDISPGTRVWKISSGATLCASKEEHPYHGTDFRVLLFLCSSWLCVAHAFICRFT